MATQGMLSVTKNGKTVLKAVAGCDGYNVKDLVKSLSKEDCTNPNKVYGKALDAGFGCHDCLVVLSADKIVHTSHDEVGGLYKETFEQPKFNPRWERGTVEHYSEVKL